MEHGVKNNMKKRVTKIFTLVLVIIFTVASIAYATTGQQQIIVDYSNIKIVVDGQQVNPKDANGKIVEPFIYNGTTYLPVRALAEALGKNVIWDSITSTVTISSNEPTSFEATPPESSVSQDKVVFLDTLAPQSFEHQGSYDSYSSIGKNKSYIRGVDIQGSHAMTLTYSLDCNFNTFRSDLYFINGWGNGPSIVKIYGDDKILYTSPGMIHNTLTQSINLDISGFSQLKFEFSDNGGRFIFAEAHLIKD